MSPVIALRGLGKRYWKLEERVKLSQAMLPFVKPRREELWALRNIDLEVAAGETIGVLGHNGAGKTTLLRLLAGVTRPTEGHLRVVGRIAPLISLGVGFHQEMSGRENVLVNGMLLGLTAQQVAERFDSIVEFAELEDFIDTPVKFYSSGMFMRLGFAVVVHVDPTILLVDEILAVGDAGFQLKCFERLRELQQQGAAIVVVSHSLPTIRQLCRRAVLISHGQLLYDGEVEATIAQYEAAVDGTAADTAAGPVEVVDLRIAGSGPDEHHAVYDERLELLLRLHFNEPIDDPQICFGVLTSGGLFGGVTATQAGQRWRTFGAGEEAEVRIGFSVRLGPGSYLLATEIKERDGGRVLARSGGLPLTVSGAADTSGFVDVGARVEIAREQR
jgi:ABC-type polysaccharide/polyol phosphate transport system ATPase subunit